MDSECPANVEACFGHITVMSKVYGGFEFQAIYDYVFTFGCRQNFVKHQRYCELLTPPFKDLRSTICTNINPILKQKARQTVQPFLRF